MKSKSPVSSCGNARLKVSVVSFAYSMGLPMDADGGSWDGFVFDCRSLPDPYFEDGLSEYSGLDQPVIDFFNRHKEQVGRFLDAAESLVCQSIEAGLEAAEDNLQVAFGCHGGHHRSVYCAERLAERLAGIDGVEVTVTHTARQYWVKSISISDWSQK